MTGPCVEPLQQTCPGHRQRSRRHAYPRCMAVAVVLTERKDDLTESRARNYERLRERVAIASGDTVEVAYYEDLDPERLRRASSVVLSGSSAPWSAHDPGELETARRGGPSGGPAGPRDLRGHAAPGRLRGRHDRAERTGEHGYLPIQVHDRSELLRGLPREAVVFQDHDDEVVRVPAGFRVLASSAACRGAGDRRSGAALVGHAVPPRGVPARRPVPESRSCARSSYSQRKVAL